MISLLFWAYLPDVLVFRRILKAVIVFEIRGSESEDKFCRPDVEQQVSEEIGELLQARVVPDVSEVSWNDWLLIDIILTYTRDKMQ